MFTLLLNVMFTIMANVWSVCDYHNYLSIYKDLNSEYDTTYLVIQSHHKTVLVEMCILKTIFEVHEK